jgi:uncharacterized protein with PQ loop repeat
MNFFDFIGTLGMMLVVIAWIPQTLRTIRTRKVGIHPKFLWIYFFGSILLAVYAFFIFDFVFILLNGTAIVFSLINIYYHYTYEKKEKKKRKGK